MSAAARSAARKKGRLLPLLCNLLGTLILLAVILTFLPLTVPRLFGLSVYHVESPSMTPEIPQGSVVFLEPAEAPQIEAGEVIAFTAEDSVVIHRVVQNRTVEGEFVTKGDANPVEDITPVPYAALLGRMRWHLPVLGGLLALYSSPAGKLYAFLLAASGLMFHLLAGRLRARQSEKLRESIAEELTARSEEQPAQAPEAPDAEHPDRRRRHRRKGKVILILVLLAVFLGSGAAVLLLTGRYRASRAVYEAAAEQYVSPAPTGESAAVAPSLPDTPTEAAAQEKICAPITVDFASLQAQNPDIVGWIYCEDTPINYPLLHGATNDTYLRTGYDGTYCYAGSIFLDAQNRGDFTDDNTIVYGHNLRDGTMFACLENWAEEDFFRAHPVLWLLTPTQDYRIDLFAGYLTDAASAVYTRSFSDAQARAEYLAKALANADVRAGVTPQAGPCVLLSTCAYDYETARYVLHGVLTPVG